MNTRKVLVIVVAVILSCAVTACDFGLGGAGDSCDNSSDCAGDLRCSWGSCSEPSEYCDESDPNDPCIMCGTMPFKGAQFLPVLLLGWILFRNWRRAKRNNPA
jgi:hypothetical protein